MRKTAYIFGIISILLLVLGLVFKTNAMAGSAAILAIGTVLFILGFVVPFTIDRISVQSRRALKISTIILTVSVGLIITGGVFKILHLPGAALMFYTGAIMIMIYLVFFAKESEGRKLQLRKDRQLAAILFTDIVGFTAMMGEDEDKALRILDHNRRTQQKVIKKHRGKWLKEMGDGSLVIFYTATEAIAASIEIQNQIQDSGDYNVRMGIHISEIVFTDTDVFGDGVNVASRISDKASANEICISEAVFQNVRNRENLNIEFMGELTLKNVPYKLALHKINTSPGTEGAKIRKLAN